MSLNSRTKNRSPYQQRKRKNLKRNDPIPEDIRGEWLEVIRQLQARCSGNKGLATITITIGVNGITPYYWTLPTPVKISPMRLSDTGMTDEARAALLAQMNRNGQETID